MNILYALGVAILVSACTSIPQALGGGDQKPASARGETVLVPAPPSLERVAADPNQGLGQTAAPQLKVAAARSVANVPGSLANRPDVQAFIQEMAAKHRFDVTELEALFSRARSQPDIIALMTRPAEAKPWYAYRKIFLTSKRIQGGALFWKAHQADLAKAEQIYGVPAEIIVAIIGVETMYGGNTGRHRVLEALATLAFDYPKRADFFRKELESYLLLTRDEGIDPLSLSGSYAGAMGIGQFMPSSYRAYAVDFDGDQHRNLWTNPADAVGSVANYLSKHHWERGGPIALRASVDGNQHKALVNDELRPPQLSVKSLRQQGISPQGEVSDQQAAMLLELTGNEGLEYWLAFTNFFVITRYNHSELYAMAVYQLSQEIRRRFESQI